MIGSVSSFMERWETAQRKLRNTRSPRHALTYRWVRRLYAKAVRKRRVAA